MTKHKSELRKHYQGFECITPGSLLANAQVFLSQAPEGHVGLYVPILGEADLLPLIKNNPNINFAIPKIIDDEMVFIAYKAGDLLQTNTKFPKIQESVEGSIVIPAIIFIPGLAFDIKGYRLGRGGGYYDKYIAQRPQIKTIGVSFAQNISESLPREMHDRKMQYIVTEHMVLSA